jgi:hypothetical protein
MLTVCCNAPQKPIAFKAVSEITLDKHHIGTVVGIGPRPTVAKEVETACKAHALRRETKFTPVRLFMVEADTDYQRTTIKFEFPLPDQF